jgi:hypothetical protein
MLCAACCLLQTMHADATWQQEFGESFKAEKAQQQQPRLRRSAAAGPCIPDKYLKFIEMGKCASWTDAMDVLERHNKDAAAAAAAGKATAPGASRQKKRKVRWHAVLHVCASPAWRQLLGGYPCGSGASTALAPTRGLSATAQHRAAGLLRMHAATRGGGGEDSQAIC